MNRRRLHLLVGAAVMTLLLIPTAASGALSLWEDVPHDHTFVNDTNWMKVTGVSKGCNPPDNTQYCGDDLLTRYEMAAFMHRLSISKVVDAATAVTAELAELSEDSELLNGLDSTEIMSHTEGNDVFNVPLPADDTSYNILSIDAFNVPADGGVLAVHGNLEAYIAPDDIGAVLGFVWTEVGGDGSCDTPIQEPGGGGFILLRNGTTPETTITIVDSTSTVETIAVPAGTTRIDLCAAGIGDLTPQVGGALNATWSPSGEATASVASVDSGVTWQDILEPLAPFVEG